MRNSKKIEILTQRIDEYSKLVYALTKKLDEIAISSLVYENRFKTIDEQLHKQNKILIELEKTTVTLLKDKINDSLGGEK